VSEAQQERAEQALIRRLKEAAAAVERLQDTLDVWGLDNEREVRKEFENLTALLAYYLGPWPEDTPAPDQPTVGRPPLVPDDWTADEFEDDCRQRMDLPDIIRRAVREKWEWDGERWEAAR
jgi:hypothetical protein